MSKRNRGREKKKVGSKQEENGILVMVFKSVQVQ